MCEQLTAFDVLCLRSTNSSYPIYTQRSKKAHHGWWQYNIKNCPVYPQGSLVLSQIIRKGSFLDMCVPYNVMCPEHEHEHATETWIVSPHDDLRIAVCRSHSCIKVTGIRIRRD